MNTGRLASRQRISRHLRFDVLDVSTRNEFLPTQCGKIRNCLAMRRTQYLVLGTAMGGTIACMHIERTFEITTPYHPRKDVRSHAPAAAKPANKKHAALPRSTRISTYLAQFSCSCNNELIFRKRSHSSSTRYLSFALILRSIKNTCHAVNTGSS